MDNGPNYYMLLDLDPDVKDPAAIAKAIQDKKQRWAKESADGHTAARHKADLNLKKLSDIQRVMNDPELRRKEAEEARRLLQKERAAHLAELDGMIKVLRAAGNPWTHEAVAGMVKQLGGSVSEAQVIERLRAAGLSPAKDDKKPSAGAAKPRLDAGRMNKLRRHLALLGVADLYTFLGMEPRSSPRSLWDRADGILSEITRNGHTGTEWEARKELCSECRMLFGTDTEKQKYDNALAFEEVSEKMKGLRKAIETAGANGFLSIGAQDELVRQAGERGVEAEDARAFLEQFALQRKWDMQRAPPLPPKPILRRLLPGLILLGFCAAGYIGWQEYEDALYRQPEQYQDQDKITSDLVENAVSIAAEFGRNYYRWQDRVDNVLPRVERAAKISTQAQAEYADLVTNTQNYKRLAADNFDAYVRSVRRIAEYGQRAAEDAIKRAAQQQRTPIEKEALLLIAQHIRDAMQGRIDLERWRKQLVGQLARRELVF